MHKTAILCLTLLLCLVIAQAATTIELEILSLLAELDLDSLQASIVTNHMYKIVLIRIIQSKAASLGYKFKEEDILKYVFKEEGNFKYTFNEEDSIKYTFKGEDNYININKEVPKIIGKIFVKIHNSLI